MNFNMFVTLNIVNANITFFVQVNIVQIIDIYIYKLTQTRGGMLVLKRTFCNENYKSFLTGGGSNWNRFFGFFLFSCVYFMPDPLYFDPRLAEASQTNFHQLKGDPHQICC